MLRAIIFRFRFYRYLNVRGSALQVFVVQGAEGSRDTLCCVIEQAHVPFLV